MEMMEKYAGKRILDVGCGAGFLLGRISGELYGIDISDASIAEAQKTLGKKAVLKSGNAEKLPFSSDYFDAVVCEEVFEHLRNPQKAVNEILRVAKPGAAMIISVPSEKTLTLARLLMLKFPPKLKEHINEFTVSDMEKMFRRKAREKRFLPPFGEGLCIVKLLVFRK